MTKNMAGNHSPRPRVACEVSAERVVAARAGEQSQSLEAVNAQGLPSGTVTPGLQHANVAERQALVSALREALAPVAGRSRDITLIIPDASTRILLLDFDALPEKSEDADAVVRFRLKKSLPFDVDASSVSFDRQVGGDGVRVVAAVTPRSVLEEYEAVVRDAGYNPGAVLPSMIAALGVVDASLPTMVIKVEPGTTTFAVVDQNQLLLYRALENGGTAVTGESLVDDVNTSLVYFEDRYDVSVDRVLVTGVQSAQALQAAFSSSSNIRVEELISSSMAGVGAGSVSRSALAGVAGALVS
jgi:type IV pilus assembly protein PilM